MMDYNNCTQMELIVLNETKDAKIKGLRDAVVACEMSKKATATGSGVPDYHVLYTYLKRRIVGVF